MKSKMKPQMTKLVQAVGKLAESRQQLARQAEYLYALEVEAILQSQCCDPMRIEQVLDGMLDFCFDAQILHWYKKLCRYYFKIAPTATVSYVNAYREMWDDEKS